MRKITPFLWFDTQAEEAANFYVSVFKNSKVKTVSRYGDAGPGPKGSAMMGFGTPPKNNSPLTPLLRGSR